MQPSVDKVTQRRREAGELAFQCSAASGRTAPPSSTASDLARRRVGSASVSCGLAGLVAAACSTQLSCHAMQGGRDSSARHERFEQNVRAEIVGLIDRCPAFKGGHAPTMAHCIDVALPMAALANARASASPAVQKVAVPRIWSPWLHCQWLRCQNLAPGGSRFERA